MCVCCAIVITVANRLPRWAGQRSINVSGEPQQVHKAAQVQKDRRGKETERQTDRVTDGQVKREANRPFSQDSSVLL